jgi:hypothetical protein
MARLSNPAAPLERAEMAAKGVQVQPAKRPNEMRACSEAEQTGIPRAKLIRAGCVPASVRNSRFWTLRGRLREGFDDSLGEGLWRVSQIPECAKSGPDGIRNSSRKLPVCFRGLNAANRTLSSGKRFGSYRLWQSFDGAVSESHSVPPPILGGFGDNRRLP